MNRLRELRGWYVFSTVEILLFSLRRLSLKDHMSLCLRRTQSNHGKSYLLKKIQSMNLRSDNETSVGTSGTCMSKYFE